MEDINFASLAPRHGSRPFMGNWQDIGTSNMSGGAFSWGSLWSGIKNFGSTIKNYGSKAWNSSTGQMLRDKLKEQNFQQKVVDGLASGISGVVDLANQAVQNKINSKLDPRPPVEEPPPAVETVSSEGRGEKRPRPDREETLVTQIDEPPSYEEALKQGLPTTRPIAPMATGVLGQHTPVTLDLPPPADTQQKPVLPGPSAVVVTRPSRASLRRAASGPRSMRPVASGNWQSTLNSIVGLGVQSLKRRRCF